MVAASRVIFRMRPWPLCRARGVAGPRGPDEARALEGNGHNYLQEGDPGQRLPAAKPVRSARPPHPGKAIN